MTSDFSRALAGGRAGFPEVLEALEAFLESRGVPPSVLAPVMIAADEIISNALDHGGKGGVPPRVDVTARVANARVTMQVDDDGTAFNPLESAAPDTELAVEDRAVGGLGVLLVRKLMDEVVYERHEGRNRLRFAKTYSSDAPTT